jgi:hypothetical protein
MEGFSRRIAGIRHVVQKKSVYLLRLLDSNDTRLLKFLGVLLLVVAAVGECGRIPVRVQVKAWYANAF